MDFEWFESKPAVYYKKDGKKIGSRLELIRNIEKERHSYTIIR